MTFEDAVSGPPIGASLLVVFIGPVEPLEEKNRLTLLKRKRCNKSIIKPSRSKWYHETAFFSLFLQDAQ